MAQTQSTEATATGAVGGPPPRRPANDNRLRGRRWWAEVGWRHLVGALAVVIAVFPILFIVSAALNPLGTVASTGLIPRRFSLVHFEALFSTPSIPYPQWFMNTVIVCTVVTIGQIFCSALAAYAFSRFRFRGRRLGLLSLLLIQMFPQMLAVVALYTMFTTIGEVVPALGINTLFGYIVLLMGGALGQVWLIKGFFDSVPRELDEAAIMDGAGHATTFFRIILPLITPILAVTGLIAFIAVLGEFLLASIFLTDNDVKTLAVGLYGTIRAERNANLGIFAAGALLTAVPVILLFQFLQRFIVGGLTSGSVKG